MSEVAPTFEEQEVIMITAPESRIALTDATVVNTPRLPADTHEQLQQAGPAMWRVLGSRGLVLGHLAAITHPLGIKFAARRFHSATGRFRDLGEFWSADDALECLRHAG